MKCSNCGGDIIGNEKFCTLCGTEVEEAIIKKEPIKDRISESKAQGQTQTNNQNHNQYSNQNQYQNHNQYNDPNRNAGPNYNNSGSSNTFALKNILKFDKMITPSIIQVLFIISIVLAGIVAMFIVISSLGAMRYSSVAFLGVFAAPIAFLLIILFSRIHLELLIVIFKIHETLVEIKDKR